MHMKEIMLLSILVASFLSSCSENHSKITNEEITVKVKDVGTALEITVFDDEKDVACLYLGKNEISDKKSGSAVITGGYIFFNDNGERKPFVLLQE